LANNVISETSLCSQSLALLLTNQNNQEIEHVQIYKTQTNARQKVIKTK